MKSASQSGNGFLEILLFLPAGLLVLFSAIDCALALRERGTLRNAIRAGIHSHALALRDLRLPTRNLELGAALSYESEGSRQAEALKVTVNQIGKMMLASFPEYFSPTDEPEAFRVDGRLVSMEVDPVTGRWTAYSFLAGEQQYPALPSLLLQETFAGSRSRSAETYLNELFAREQSAVPSAFAVPATQTGRRQESFLKSTPAVLIKVSAAARGLPFRPLAKLYPNLTAIEEFAVVPLRTPLG